MTGVTCSTDTAYVARSLLFGNPLPNAKFNEVKGQCRAMGRRNRVSRLREDRVHDLAVNDGEAGVPPGVAAHQFAPMQKRNLCVRR